MDIWRDVAEKTPNLNSLTRLKLTRWSSKHNGTHNIVKAPSNLFVVIRTLTEITCLPSLEAPALVTACAILNSWLDFENIVIILLLHKVFCILDITKKKLQTYGLNLLEANKTIKSLYKDLKTLQEPDVIASMLEDVKQFIRKVNELLSTDTFLKSLNIFDEDANNDSCIISIEEIDEYDVTIFKTVIEPFVCVLLEQIEERFFNVSETEEMLVKEISFFDLKFLDELLKTESIENIHLTKLCSLNNIEDEDKVKNELSNFLLEYKNNIEDSLPESLSTFQEGITFLYEENNENTIPFMESYAELEEEWTDCANKVVGKYSCYCLQCILKYFQKLPTLKIKYKELYKLYTYIAILPMTQVKCERSFSNLKLTKNRLRTNLKETNLQNLIIISEEADLFCNIDLEDLIDEVANSSIGLATNLL